jgi:excisionase family DNA binding protein
MAALRGATMRETVSEDSWGEHVRALPDVLTVDEAAGLLRLNEQTVTRLAREGALPCVRVGGQWRFAKHRLLALLEAPDGQHPTPAAELGSEPPPQF